MVLVPTDLLSLGVAGTFAGPVLGFCWENLLKPGASGLFGKVFDRLSESKVERAMSSIATRLTQDGLPPNHDLAQASENALRDALLWMGRQLGRGPSAAASEEFRRAVETGHFDPDEAELARLPQANRRWIKALAQAARDPRALRRLESPEHGGRTVRDLLQSHQPAEHAADLHRRTREWLQSTLAGQGEVPDRLEEFLAEGWLLRGESGRMTLYQAWSWHFRESVKKRPEVFNSFVATALADLLDGRALEGDAAAALSQRFVAHLDSQLGTLLVLATQTQEDVGVIRSVVETIHQKVEALERPAPPPPFAWPSARLFDVLMADLDESFVGREQLLGHLLDRLAGVRQQALLLLADAGVGKSALMARLVRELRLRETRVALHFCRFDEQDDLRPGRILRSLAAQFAMLHAGYKRAVEGDAEAQRALINADVEPQAAWSRGVVDPLTSAGPPDGDKGIVLVIDGLDESLDWHDGASPGDSLLGLIAQGTSGRLPRWVRVVMSARRQVEPIWSQRERFECVELLTDDAQHQADLGAYVDSRLRRETLRQRLQQAGVEPAAYAASVLRRADGKFLVARYILKDAESGHLSASELQQLLRRHDAGGIDTYYHDAVTRRVQRAGLDVVRTRAVLGVVAVALRPLTERAIAHVLSELFADIDEAANTVRAVVEAFGGLLRHKAGGGVTFDHLSLEQWLDKSRPEGLNAAHRPKAGAYAIERDISMLRLQAHCLALVARPREEAAAQDFDAYLDDFGVSHLVDAKELAAALSLLMRRAQVDAPRGPKRSGPPPRRLENRLIDAMQAALHDFDKKPERRAAVAASLGQLDADALKSLLLTRDYETGKYEPVLRTLIQFKPDAWPAALASLADALAGDLVFRCDVGVAHAQAWHSSTGDDRERLHAAIVAMAENDGDPDQREIAGYALKHICQKIDPDPPWWQQMEPTIRRLAARYAGRPQAVDRMVAGEMLLALALQGVRVDTGFVDEADRERFWNPCWPNLRADIGAIVDVGMAAVDRAVLAGDIESAQTQRELALQLSARLLANPLIEPEGPGSLERLHWAVGPSFADQQCDKIALEECLDALVQALDSEDHRPVVLDVVRRIMLHPSWDLTETGSSLVADLIKRKGRANAPWWLIDRLLESPPAHWRLLYGAVDAAFNVGGVDGYAAFSRALVKVGKVDHCRVRGICADNLRMWLQKSAPGERERILRDPDIGAVLRLWLEKADDIWLLEYLQLMFSELWQQPGGVHHALVAELLSGPLSPYLAVGADLPFYRLAPDGPDGYLALVEAKRQAEAAPLSAPG